MKKSQLDKLIREEISKVLKEDHKPGPGEYGSVRISVIDDEIDILNDPNNLIDFDYSLEGNELWVWEDDKEEAYGYLGIQ